MAQVLGSAPQKLLAKLRGRAMALYPRAAALLKGRGGSGSDVTGRGLMEEMMLNPDLLAILCCPKCRGALSTSDVSLVCASCRLVYTVDDGIPNLLLDEAKPLSDGSQAGAAP